MNEIERRILQNQVAIGDVLLRRFVKEDDKQWSRLIDAIAETKELLEGV